MLLPRRGADGRPDVQLGQECQGAGPRCGSWLRSLLRIHFQLSGSLAQTSADSPAAATWIHGVPGPRASGDRQLERDLAVVARQAQAPRAGGVPAASAGAEPAGGQGPDSLKCSRSSAIVTPPRVHVQDGAAFAVVQAEDGESGAVQPGQRPLWRPSRARAPAAGSGDGSGHHGRIFPVRCGGSGAGRPGRW